MTTLDITKMNRVPDDFGGFKEIPVTSHSFDGVLDLMAHNPYTSTVSHLADTSTHIFILDYFDGFDDILKPGQTLKDGTKAYTIVYADNPLNENYHLEIYLKAEVS